MKRFQVVWLSLPWYLLSTAPTLALLSSSTTKRNRLKFSSNDPSPTALSRLVAHKNKAPSLVSLASTPKVPNFIQQKRKSLSKLLGSVALGLLLGLVASYIYSDVTSITTTSRNTLLAATILPTQRSSPTTKTTLALTGTVLMAVASGALLGRQIITKMGRTSHKKQHTEPSDTSSNELHDDDDTMSLETSSSSTAVLQEDVDNYDIEDERYDKRVVKEAIVQQEAIPLQEKQRQQDLAKEMVQKRVVQQILDQYNTTPSPPPRKKPTPSDAAGVKKMTQAQRYEQAILGKPSVENKNEVESTVEPLASEQSEPDNDVDETMYSQSMPEALSEKSVEQLNPQDTLAKSTAQENNKPRVSVPPQPSESFQRSLLAKRLQIDAATAKSQTDVLAQSKDAAPTGGSVPMETKIPAAEQALSESHQRALLATRLAIEAASKAAAQKEKERERTIQRECQQRALLATRLAMQQKEPPKVNLDEKYGSIKDIGERAFAILKDLGMLDD